MSKYSDIQYPDYPFDRIVNVKVKDSKEGKYQFDDNYPYYEDSFSYKLKRALNAFFLRWPGRLFLRLCFGFRMKGRDILKKYKKELAKGGVSVCNHVKREDAVMVCHALNKFRSIHLPVYAKHMNNNGFYWMLHSMGGVPVAETMGGMKKFNEAFDKFHEKGDWIHVFAEEVRWDLYPYIRPFRKGAFTMAYKYNCPLVPLVITFRERKGFFKLTGPKDLPLFTIEILEPVFPDKSQRRETEVLRMLKEAHARMVKAAGIENNPWPANPAELPARN